MKTSSWTIALVALLVAFLVTIPTGCSTQQAPVTQEPAAQAVEQKEEPVYTRTDPGAWEGKQSSHIPVIAYKKTGSGLQVTVTVKHVMDPKAPHFIEWIKLTDGDGKALGEASFAATDKIAEATFELSSAPAKLIAIERCNIHGRWKEEVPVT
ncbi:MAG: hypothetical protein IT158_23520 [Bryobacterales bacterium]|nr:hypothetical protein [Bryobacterales bacterium]